MQKVHVMCAAGRNERTGNATVHDGALQANQLVFALSAVAS